jgi:hypothetical protein
VQHKLLASVCFLAMDYLCCVDGIMHIFKSMGCAQACERCGRMHVAYLSDPALRCDAYCTVLLTDYYPQ